MIEKVLQWAWDQGFRAGFNRAVRVVRGLGICKRCQKKLDAEPCLREVLD